MVPRINPNPNLINIDAPRIYDHVERFFNQQISVCIEGNIAAGKTTFINRLVTKAEILSLREPLDKWRDVNNINLLERAYQDPINWTFAFQNYVLVTMMKNHLQPATTKILERSIGSAHNVFLRAHQRRETINPAQVKILEEWYELMMTYLPAKMDVIIYLRVAPEKALKRLQKRNRPEERHINIDYLRTLDELYEQWLYNNPGIKVITLNANRSTEHMLRELNFKIRNNEM